MAQTTYNPPVNTYIPIASVTLASSATEIVFTGWDPKYRDLVLVANPVSASIAADQAINFNGDDNSANYSCVIMWGSGSSKGGTTSSFIIDFYGSANASNNNVTILQIFDASSSDKDTTYLSRANRAPNGLDAVAGRWNNTDPVTSITYFLNGASLDVGTAVNLYGIEA